LLTEGLGPDGCNLPSSSLWEFWPEAFRPMVPLWSLRALQRASSMRGVGAVLRSYGALLVLAQLKREQELVLVSVQPHRGA